MNKGGMLVGGTMFLLGATLLKVAESLQHPASQVIVVIISLIASVSGALIFGFATGSARATRVEGTRK